MDAVICRCHSFGEALGLVIHAAWADRIDMPPVRFRLGMYLRVAVDFRGAGEEESGLLGFRQPERIVGSQCPDLERLDGQLEVIDGARGRRKVQHRI